MPESVPTSLPARYRGFTIRLIEGDFIEGIPDAGIPLPPNKVKILTGFKVSEPTEEARASEIKGKLEDLAEAIDAWLDKGNDKVSHPPPGCKDWRNVRGTAAADSVQTYLKHEPTEEEAWTQGMKIIPRINGEATKVGGSVGVLTYPTVIPLADGRYQFFIDVGIQRVDGSWYTQQDMLNAFADETKALV